MPTIVHFDVPVDDVERAKRFYCELFDWQIERVPGPMEYYNIATADEDGSPGVGGGMGERRDPSQQITNYVGVPDVDTYIRRVTELGGRVVMPKTPVSGFGYLAVCLDTEGNSFGLWETDENVH